MRQDKGSVFIFKGYWRQSSRLKSVSRCCLGMKVWEYESLIVRIVHSIYCFHQFDSKKRRLKEENLIKLDEEFRDGTKVDVCRRRTFESRIIYELGKNQSSI
jgi:hypothetical protein